MFSVTFIAETHKCSRGFSPTMLENAMLTFNYAQEFSQTLLRFSTGYGGTDNMLYFFNKIIIFIVNKEKDDIRSAYCKFSQLGDSQTTLLTSFSCFMKNTLVDQSKPTYYSNYFIKVYTVIVCFPFFFFTYLSALSIGLLFWTS